MAFLRSACFVLGLIPVAIAHAAEFVAPATCPADIAALDASFQETQQRLHDSEFGGEAEKCAAIKHHIEVMANGINVFQRCMEDGHDKGENFAQLGASIEDFLTINEQQGCAGFELPKLDLPQ